MDSNTYSKYAKFLSADDPVHVYCLCALYIVSSTIGVINNCIVFLSTVKRNKRHRIILNLCITDLLVNLIAGPTTIIMLLNQDKWEYGDSACKAVSFLQSIPSIASPLSVKMLAVDRYMSIQHPFAFNRINKLETLPIKSMLYVWSVSIIMSIPIYFVREVDANEVCVENWGDRVYLKMAYELIYLIVLFYGPALTILASHLAIGSRIFPSSLRKAAAIGDIALPMPIISNTRNVLVVTSKPRIQPLLMKLGRRQSTTEEFAHNIRMHMFDPTQEQNGSGHLRRPHTQRTFRSYRNCRNFRNSFSAQEENIPMRNLSQQAANTGATIDERDIPGPSRPISGTATTTGTETPRTSQPAFTSVWVEGQEFTSEDIEAYKQSLDLRRRLVTMLFIISAVFTLCWSPYVLFKTYYVFAKPKNPYETMKTMQIFLFLAHFHSTINPIIYILMNRKIVNLNSDLEMWYPSNWMQNRYCCCCQIWKLMHDSGDSYSPTSTSYEIHGPHNVGPVYAC